jgi:hypothetical protein
MGGATARGAFCGEGRALGGVAVGRSELQGAVRSMRLASGDIEMASHGDALVNLGSGLAHPSGFAILDLLCGLSPAT